jgi:uncharacterized protein (TIGR02145 family)
MSHTLYLALNKSILMKLTAPFLFLALFLPFLSFSQSPATIPYQAVVRNTDGSAMANASLNITLIIHDVTANGSVVYEESHATSSNAQGLISLNVGQGSAVFGTINGVNWSTGNKFLQVLMNAGNGNVDLGTQQMMSVPYALHTNDTYMRVSATGDSLIIGNTVTIVPGISAANPPAVQSIFDADGNAYTSVIVGEQEWLAQNLKTTKYCNGDPLVTDLISISWQSSSVGSWAHYNDDPSMDETFGKLYNFYAVTDTRSVCPCGWHVPTTIEWNTLFVFLGGPSVSGGLLKSTANWNTPNTGATNAYGFGAQGGGYRLSNGNYSQQNVYGYFWTKNVFGSDGVYRRLSFDSAAVQSLYYSKRGGLSVRCIKD